MLSASRWNDQEGAGVPPSRGRVITAIARRTGRSSGSETGGSRSHHDDPKRRNRGREGGWVNMQIADPKCRSPAGGLADGGAT